MGTGKNSFQNNEGKTSMIDKKLIYIMNSYSKNDASHFFHILGLLEELASRNIQIILIIEKASESPVFISKKIQVVTLKKWCGIGRYFELMFTLKKYIKLGYKNTFIRITTLTAFFAAITHKIYGGNTYLWLSGTTLEYDRDQPLSKKKIKWFFTARLFYKIATKAVSHFVTGPTSMVDYYATVGGVKREKIKLLFNDIDLRRFTNTPEKKKKIREDILKRYNIPNNALILLLVHRLSPVRRTELYFPLCLKYLKDNNSLENVFVLVAGGGPELQQIKSLSKEYEINDHCHFLGNIPNKEIQDLYLASNIFIHPTFNEGFPRVILEAMACGLPIVSTDAGGTRELLGPTQQIMISSKENPQAFFENLLNLINSRNLQETLSMENIKVVTRFSTENIAKMYEEVIFNAK